MPSVTVENYLKTIYLHQQRRPREELVPMGELASAMSVTPGTATSMVKNLSDQELVDYEPRGGVRLTRTGDKTALQVLRRHRLVEVFLVEVLGLDWAEVHDEAEELEHAISDKLLDRLDAFLGYPEFDPHGDPIPSAKGMPKAAELVDIVEAPQGRAMRVARIKDQDPAFLRFLERCGLTPGQLVTVTGRDAVADAVTVHPDGKDPVTLGTSAGRKIMLRPASQRR